MRKYTCFLLISISMLLTGCAAALVGGGAAGGYYLAKDKGSAGNYTDDAVITSKVKSKLLKDLALKSFSISVSTNHGVVSLTGNVPNVQMQERAIILTQNTKGVKSVNASNLTVSAGK